MIHTSDDTPEIQETIPFTLWELIKYFLWLGTTGFGGPIALIGYMQRDLIEQKRWYSNTDYLHGMALAQLCPGPLASQLAIYLGWLKFGIKGASCVVFALTLPSFVMVLIMASIYIHFGSLTWMQGAFYGISASVIAILVRSGLKFVRITVDRTLFLIIICLSSTLLTLYYKAPFMGAIVLSGIIYMLFTSPPKSLIRLIHRLTNKSNHPSLVLFPPWLLTGINTPASEGILLKLLGYFSWAGAFLFGSGLAIIPFLNKGVVEDYHWLTQQQFLDAVAIGLITPGPALITVAFIGFLVAGFMGATVATIGIFFPSYAIIITIAPHYRRIVRNHSVQTFVKGVTSAIAGSIIASVLMLGQKAIMDIYTIVIFLGSCVLLYSFKKLPVPLIIITAGVIGTLLR